MNILIVGGERSGEFVSTIGWPLGMLELARPLQPVVKAFIENEAPTAKFAFSDLYRLTDVKHGAYTVMVYALDGMTADQVVETWEGLQS